METLGPLLIQSHKRKGRITMKKVISIICVALMFPALVAGTVIEEARTHQGLDDE